MGSPLLIGSGNLKKARELQDLLEGTRWEVKSLADFPAVPEPVEDGDTFEANAVKKAQYYAGAFAVSCVADDSGLVVDALDGAPGVHSARYAGPDHLDAANVAKLLDELADVPEARRTARFVCCAAFVSTDGLLHTETGVIEGRIALAPRGSSGFGYDPVFIPEDHDRTFAEMPLADKQAISHRGRAFRKLREYLAVLP